MDHLVGQGPDSGTVYIVDDEPCLRGALAGIVETAGWDARLCDSGTDLLGKLDDASPACIVLDLSMPGQSGLEVQAELIARSIQVPIVFLSGVGTVSAATRALHNGAIDFLEKPVEAPVFIARVGAALHEHLRRLERTELEKRFAMLSARESEVCVLLIRGLASKSIGAALSISARTVEHHRERILKKTHARNVADLATLYALAHRSRPGRGPAAIANSR